MPSDFLKLWSAETISQFGSTIDDIAFALVVLVLDATAFEVAALGTVLFLPFILFTLPAGVWVDRLPRRPILIAGDFGRAACTRPFRSRMSRTSSHSGSSIRRVPRRHVPGLLRRRLPVVPSVPVDRDQIVEGNSKLEISRSAAQISGPGLGGILVEILTALRGPRRRAELRRVRRLPARHVKPEPKPERATVDGRKTTMRHELKEGLRFVLGNPNRARKQAAPSRTSSPSVAFSIPALVFAVRELELSPGVIGFKVFSLGAAGSLVAALTATRISRRFGIGPTTIVVAAIFGPAMLLVAFPAGERSDPFFVAAQLLFGFTVVVYNIVQVSYRQAICPPRLQGRMNSVMRFVVWGTIPIGTLLGGRPRVDDRAPRDDRRRSDRRRARGLLDRLPAAAPARDAQPLADEPVQSDLAPEAGVGHPLPAEPS